MRALDKPKGKRVHNRRTICEVHRHIYDLLMIRYNDDEIADLLDEAFVIGIKMNNKLVEYKYIYERECCRQDTKKLEELRKLRIELIGE